MNHVSGEWALRPVEERDLPRLHAFKNDPEVASFLGGFHRGMSAEDLEEWHDRHRRNPDEVLWTIAATEDDRCLGHVGLYAIDHRIGSAEFGIMIGDQAWWGRGVGTEITSFVVSWGFQELNLNRIALTVVETNERAAHVYQKLGFVLEGRLRQAQFRHGKYVDVLQFAVLRGEWPGREE